MREASYHLTLLCQNRVGFQNLLKMASAAYLEGFYFKPRIDKELLAAHSEGIICLSGCVSSELNRLLLRGSGGEVGVGEVDAVGARPKRLHREPTLSVALRTELPRDHHVEDPREGIVVPELLQVGIQPHPPEGRAVSEHDAAFDTLDAGFLGPGP